LRLSGGSGGSLLEQVDLAGIEHWDSRYRTAGPAEVWCEPSDYGSIALTRELIAEIERSKPASILEVGCGNSIWLPYVGLKSEATVAGLDYSEVGCELARSQLAAAGVPGRIFCGDLFNINAAEVGRYDFVYSLGMVEHFTDTVEVLSKLLGLVNPGGVLFTEVPNLKSIHGLLSWIWQPELLAKHYPLGKRDLITAYKKLGLEEVRGHFAGVFSLDIVAWPIYPRWPRLAPWLLPTITRARNSVDYRMRRWGRFEGGTAPLAPYLCVIGHKPTR
jgi:SAM-dependent methyltransferase